MRAINNPDLQTAYLGGSTLSAVQGIDYIVKVTEALCISQWNIIFPIL